jgi:hypothetical protein
VYATSTTPQSCSDFPVYDDGDAVTADLRCEAVRAGLDDLRARLRAVAKSGDGVSPFKSGDGVSPFTIVEERDPEHPETFVSFVPRKKKAR